MGTRDWCSGPYLLHSKEFMVVLDKVSQLKMLGQEAIKYSLVVVLICFCCHILEETSSRWKGPTELYRMPNNILGN